MKQLNAVLQHGAFRRKLNLSQLGLHHLRGELAMGQEPALALDRVIGEIDDQRHAEDRS